MTPDRYDSVRNPEIIGTFLVNTGFTKTLRDMLQSHSGPSYLGHMKQASAVEKQAGFTWATWPTFHSLAILLATLTLVFALPAHCLADAQSSAFGSSTQSEAALVGVLYDLKQTQDHQPTSVDPETYTTVIDEFLSKGWDESVLNRYYRVSRPLYTTQIFIPNMNADKAPEAFGAQKTVKPSRWVIHYKGQLSAPETGTYRFWGIADDVMAAAVNGKTVVVGARRDVHMLKPGWKVTGGAGA